MTAGYCGQVADEAVPGRRRQLRAARAAACRRGPAERLIVRSRGGCPSTTTANSHQRGRRGASRHVADASDDAHDVIGVRVAPRGCRECATDGRVASRGAGEVEGTRGEDLRAAASSRSRSSARSSPGPKRSGISATTSSPRRRREVSAGRSRHPAAQRRSRAQARCRRGSSARHGSSPDDPRSARRLALARYWTPIERGLRAPRSRQSLVFMMTPPRSRRARRSCSPRGT